MNGSGTCLTKQRMHPARRRPRPRRRTPTIIAAARAHNAGDGGAVAGGTKRFSAKRKLAIVQRLLRGESLDAVSREENVPVHRLTAWRDKVLMGAESALAARERDARDDEIARRAGPRWARSPWRSRVKKSVRGTDFSEERVAVRKDRQAGGRPPFGPAEIEEMSQAHSISTRRRFGMSRVCRIWGAPRATVYRHRGPAAGAGAANAPRPPRRRGPQGACSDAELLLHIQAVIAASPFSGEG